MNISNIVYSSHISQNHHTILLVWKGSSVSQHKKNRMILVDAPYIISELNNESRDARSSLFYLTGI